MKNSVDDDPQSRRRSSVRDLLAEKSGAKKLSSARSSGMESSILRFKDVNFVVGKGEKQKNILTDVNGSIRWGHVLALMGPSGAGKTTLINALTLDAFYGTPTGTVTLNGVPLTGKIFKEHCYVVKQHDKHWPYLTTRETLEYCAELYEVAAKEDISEIVSEIISSMGLDSCADTRAVSLSGGQQRRLSVAVALLKSPTVLFLDEPTSGLDAASAAAVMEEISRVAKDEHLIICCTIHQPSTKVYCGFDQVMILSKGRVAFAGETAQSTEYFDSIGYPLPPATNPAEHFLDLVNADFSSSEEVDKILDTWEEKRTANASLHGKDGFGDSGQEGVVDSVGTSLLSEIKIMFRRHTTLIIRDPVLYLGRCLIFLVANLVFGFVYFKARDPDQAQVFNKLWVNIWFMGVPCNMGVVAVYALNDEFKSILRETKNGMVSPSSYALAKTVLVIPIMYIFALFAMGIPGFAVQDFPGAAFGRVTLLFAVCIYVFETFAELLAVACEDPIMGMLNFMNFWFAAFLFGGFLISLDDIPWPFKIFYYIMPYSYYIRSVMYAIFTETTWDPCIQEENPEQPVCLDTTDGTAVLGGLSRVYPLMDTEDTFAEDIGILLALAVFYKVCTIFLIQRNAKKCADIQSP